MQQTLQELLTEVERSLAIVLFPIVLTENI